MFHESAEPDSVGRYLAKVRGRLADEPRLDTAVRAAAENVPGSGDPAARVRAMLPAKHAPTSSASAGSAEPYLVRDAAISMLQSALDEKLFELRGDTRRGGPGRWWRELVRRIERLTRPGRFTPDDPDWVLRVSQAWLEHLATGTAPFNPRPAHHQIAPDARLVLFGDWGTGPPRAQAVAARITESLDQALRAGREAHVIHLGDVYYSGQPHEYQRHALRYWPVTTDQLAAGVTSWSLNGNHDMYSGGSGYFHTLLADPRFHLQRCANGNPTSYFHLDAGPWSFLGLDTAWRPERLADGLVGELADPQAQLVQALATGPHPPKIALLSHHQFLSVYSPHDVGEQLPRKLGAALGSGHIRAWWWGHEHICMGFRAHQGVAYPRCIGHGGVPTPLAEASTSELIAWEERDTFTELNQQYRRFGYAVLDLDHDHVNAHYHNDTGELTRTERLS